jgi:hypothetical protein
MSESPVPRAEPADREAAAAERRARERRPCDCVTFCVPCPAPASHVPAYYWPAQVQDLSAGGVGLTTEHPFEPGTGLRLDYGGSPAGPAGTLQATVIHVRAEPAGCWTLGCKFVTPLTRDELDDLLFLELPRFD